jgi:hypothetical protein
MFPSVRLVVISNGTTEWFRERLNEINLPMGRIRVFWHKKKLIIEEQNNEIGLAN